jgi:imidazole glycerol-phosphate synthase subunit HisH
LNRPTVAVLNYGMGNLRSVAKALEAAGAKAVVTSETSEVLGCEALCVPGQGIFGRCMDNLKGAGQDVLIHDWLAASRPYLGICLGMQILFESSEERGPIEGLSVLPGSVGRLRGNVRVPHMGWGVVNSEHYYFDHSYAAFPANDSFVTGWCTHGLTFAAMVRNQSMTAVQFHPEKSGAAGIGLLRDWLAAVPSKRNVR